jgi:hypothetical protein
MSLSIRLKSRPARVGPLQVACVRWDRTAADTVVAENIELLSALFTELDLLLIKEKVSVAMLQAFPALIAEEAAVISAASAARLVEPLPAALAPALARPNKLDRWLYVVNLVNGQRMFLASHFTMKSDPPRVDRNLPLPSESVNFMIKRSEYWPR